MIEFRILGPVEVRGPDGCPIPIPSRLQRALLTRLILEAGRVVSCDTLIDDLWEADPPGRPENSLRYHVWKLRDALDPGRPPRTGGNCIHTEQPGYRFDAAGVWIDLRVFEELISGGRALSSTDPEAARRAFTEALGLWRGVALGGVDDWEFARRERRRLDELRIQALEGRIDADLALGSGEDLVAELEELVDRHPWRERLRGQLMVALDRSGRRAEALEVYRRARSLLADELGIEPTPELQRVEEEILLGRREPVHASGLEPAEELSVPATPLVGRERDLEDVRVMLSTRRLVTLRGPPGVGKTRLAVEVARSASESFPDGAWFLDIPAAQSGGGGILEALAGRLGIAGEGDRRAVRHRTGPSPRDSVVEYFRRRRGLLVLDNCETGIDEVAGLIDLLLPACPSLCVLATSRRAIRRPDEWIHDVDPLSSMQEERARTCTWPELLEAPAISLFVQRAEAAGATLAKDEAVEIARLCRHLDGIPLALELAAARSRSMSPRDLLEHLDERFRLLDEGARSSLRAAIESSADLMSGDEKRAAAILSVFGGAFDLEAADFVLADTGAMERPTFVVIARLVEDSLLAVVPGVPRRYRMLESIREFFSGQLRTEEGESQANEAHIRYVESLAESAWDAQLDPLAEAEVFQRIDRNDREVLLAFERLREAGDDCRAQIIAGALCGYWLDRERDEEGLRICEAIAERCDELDALRQARFLYASSSMLKVYGQRERMLELASDSYRLALEAGRQNLAAHALMIIMAPDWTGVFDHLPHDSRWDEVISLARASGDRRTEGWALHKRGDAHRRLHEDEASADLLNEALEIFEEVGDDAGVAWSLVGLSTIARDRGDLCSARSIFDRIGDRRRSMGAWHAYIDGELARAEGNLDRTIELESLALAEMEERSPASLGTNTCRCSLGWAHRVAGDHETAMDLMVESLRFLLRSTNESRWNHGVWVLESLAGLCAESFDARLAAILFGSADAARETQDNPMPHWDRPLYESDLATLRERLPAHEFADCWERGRRLTPGEAARRAIRELSPLLE